MANRKKFLGCPCGLMDKALPSGGRDCGFESRLGLIFCSCMCWVGSVGRALVS